MCCCLASYPEWEKEKHNHLCFVLFWCVCPVQTKESKKHTTTVHTETEPNTATVSEGRKKITMLWDYPAVVAATTKT